MTKFPRLHVSDLPLASSTPRRESRSRPAWYAQLLAAARRITRAASLAFVVAGLAGLVQANSALPTARGGVSLGWKGKTYDAAEPPAALPPELRVPVNAWLVWAREYGYRFDYDESGRVLLVSAGKSGTPSKKLETLARVETWFDATLPLPQGGTSAPATGAAPRPPAPSGGGIPEDPESAPPSAPGSDTSGKTPAKSSASQPAAFVPDSQPALLFVVRNDKDFETLLAELAARHTDLKNWASSAKVNPGFVLEQPLCGAYVENAAGQEEWSPEHELVHRTAELLLLRRFGRQPYWVSQGIGWEAEHRFDGSMYCFPYRTEFVFAAEHGAWPNTLRQQFKDRDDQPVDWSEACGLRRGTYLADAAHIAWGLMHVACTTQGPKLALALDELRTFRDQDNRAASGAHTWERIDGYEVAAAKQKEIFERHLGAEFTTRATAWFRSPNSPPPQPDKNDRKRP